MKNPRHLFILVGILSQGLTWDSYSFLAVATGLWWVIVSKVHGRTRYFTLTTEAIALVLGCVGSILVSKALGRSAHFFLGDGLVLLQLVRLARPLTRREKLTSLLVACFHFGVLCTLAPNIRFILLYLGAICFFPGALKEIFHTTAAEDGGTTVPSPIKITLVPSLRVCFWLLLGSAFAFITFPRFTGTPLQLREGFTDQGSLLDSILDPRRGGRANSQQVLMQIDGDDVGYMRCMALTEFDGVRWSADKRSRLLAQRWYSEESLKSNKRIKHRRIFVKNSQYLGRVVPTDGKPLFMRQNFFPNPVMQTDIGGTLEVHSMWSTGNNVYEYYMDPEGEPEQLRPEFRERLTYHPPQSERLKSWLEDVVSAGTNEMQRARLLALHLRNNFKYELGTPELSRLTPVDDFIFNRQEGHCERFAATMALLLRMQGVPSRVIVGYVPTSRNLFSGRLQVRFRDAHSWTEGYFEGAGWVKFDATPGPPPGSGGSDFLDMLEELDFAWYSHIVNFNGFGQRELFASSTRFIGNLPRQSWNIAAGTIGAVLLVLLCARIKGGRTLSLGGWFKSRRRSPEAIAKHQYEEMLQLFRRAGVAKTDQQTPFEFLDVLRGNANPAYSSAAVVTRNFCRRFYGGKPLTAEEQAEAGSALRRMKELFESKNATVHQPERN